MPKLTLTSIKELIELVVSKQLEFDDKESARTLVNTLCDGLFERESLYSELKAYGAAEDLDEYFYENWAEGYDWFDVIDFNFDLESLTSSVLTGGDLYLRYTDEDAEGLLSETLSNWHRQVKSYLFDNI